MEEDVRQLYKFKFDCGCEVIQGLFFAEPEEVEMAIGRDVHIGEVRGILRADEVELVDLGEDLPAVRRHADAISIGHNPLDYIRCEKCQCADMSVIRSPSGICDYCREM